MLNKMPESNVEETGSAPSHSFQRKKVVILQLLLAAAVLFLASTAFAFLSDKQLIINGQKYNVTIADTAKERENGLSGWERLGDNQGMLFVYTDAGQYCMWMKDMRFTIDLVWLDSNKKVVGTKANATPDSYPEAFCQNNDAQYVLEVPEGTIAKQGIKPGDQAKF